MKKMSIGFIFGLVLALSVTVSAEVYQFVLSPHSLFVDGEEIEQPMFLKDGTNYLPLRAVSEALGTDVTYKDGRIDIIENNLETVAANCKDSCVMIYAENDTAISQGSGWVYNGYVVTAKHVVDGYDKINVFVDDSKYGVPGEIYYTDPELDMAVIKADVDLPSVKLGDSDKLKEGERLVSITSPGGGMNTIDECINSGLMEYDDGMFLTISESNMNSGSSGGAVFNYNSDIIAMAKAGDDGGQHTIPINDIKPILEKLK